MILQLREVLGCEWGYMYSRKHNGVDLAPENGMGQCPYRSVEFVKKLVGDRVSAVTATLAERQKMTVFHSGRNSRPGGGVQIEFFPVQRLTPLSTTLHLHVCTYPHYATFDASTPQTTRCLYTFSPLFNDLLHANITKKHGESMCGGRNPPHPHFFLERRSGGGVEIRSWRSNSHKIPRQIRPCHTVPVAKTFSHSAES